MMTQVRPRSRRKLSKPREREVQGMLLGTFGSDDQDSLPRSLGRAMSSDPRRPKSRKVAEVPLLPYRQVLATWPVASRERWGRLTNAIEDLGIAWREAESRAFVEIWGQYRAELDVLRN